MESCQEGKCSYLASASTRRNSSLPHSPYSAPACSYVVTHPAFNISSERLFPDAIEPGRNNGFSSTIATCIWELQVGQHAWYHKFIGAYDARVLITMDDSTVERLAFDGVFEPGKSFRRVWLGRPAEMCRLWCIHSRYTDMNSLVFQFYVKRLVDDDF